MIFAAEWWEVVSAAGTAAGAIAAAVGAIAAWRAASASRGASRDALEALAVGIRPRLRMQVRPVPTGGDKAVPTDRAATLRITNAAEFPALDLALTIADADGNEKSRASRERLDPTPSSAFNDAEPYWDVPVTHLKYEIAVGTTQRARAALLYSDSRRHARYELSLSFTRSINGAVPGHIDLREHDVSDRRVV